MNERPILFSGDMVRAILDGRKTQTRRVISVRNTLHSEDMSTNHNAEITGVIRNKGTFWTFGLSWIVVGIQQYDAVTIKCPYGKPGDLLWVRETWRIIGWHEGVPYLLQYKADGATAEEPGDSSKYDEDKYTQYTIDSTNDCIQAKIPLSEDGFYYFNSDVEIPTRWRPSIFMPRWASRLTLKIINIWPERLQEISILDCNKEGYPVNGNGGAPWGFRPIIWFQELWDSINAKRGYPWDSNPWVWVIEFERCQNDADNSR